MSMHKTHLGVYVDDVSFCLFVVKITNMNTRSKRVRARPEMREDGLYAVWVDSCLVTPEHQTPREVVALLKREGEALVSKHAKNPWEYKIELRDESGAMVVHEYDWELLVMEMEARMTWSRGIHASTRW